MVSKVILWYGKNRFCLHISHKNAGLIKKKDLIAEKQDLFEKKMRGILSPFSGKKVLGYKKTGIAKAKKYKNRIYLRKKGNDKNREKKDFFPPGNITCNDPSASNIQL